MKAYMERRIEPAMPEISPPAGFRYGIMVQMPGMSLGPNHRPVAIMKQLTGSNGPSKVSPRKVSYGTEGGFHRDAGTPAIIRGPGHIAQARQSAGYVAQGQLDSRGTFIRHLAARLLVKA
jgi:acetylornithine deacetylase